MFQDNNNNNFESIPKVVLSFNEREKRLTSNLMFYGIRLDEKIDEFSYYRRLINKSFKEGIKEQNKSLDDVEKALQVSIEIQENVKNQYELIMEFFNKKPNRIFTDYLFKIIKIASKQEKQHIKFTDCKYIILSKYYE